MTPLRAERDKKERRLEEEGRAAAVLQSAAQTRAARRAVARRHAEILEAARRERGRLTIQVGGICGNPRQFLSGLLCQSLSVPFKQTSSITSRLLSPERLPRLLCFSPLPLVRRALLSSQVSAEEAGQGRAS